MHSFKSVSILAALAALAIASPVPIPEAEAASEIVARTAAKVNDASLSLIEELEGFRANFYTIDGHKTIGYGHDCTEQQDCGSIHPPLSKKEGGTLLRNDIKSFESCVCALPHASKLNANEYGALVSFTYNSGCGGVQNYFESDMKKSAFSSICKSLPTSNTLGGELSSRRKKEGALCSKHTTAKSGC